MSRILPPSPNWYSSRLSDWNEAGLVIFASKNNVQLFDSRQKRFLAGNGLQGHTKRVTAVKFLSLSTPKDHTQLPAPTDEASSSISTYHLDVDAPTPPPEQQTLTKANETAGRTYCMSSSADGTVKIWHIETRRCVYSHNQHKSSEVTSVSASPFYPDCIVSGDKNGNVVLWQCKYDPSLLATSGANITTTSSSGLQYSAFKQFSGHRSAVTCVECSTDVNHKATVAVGYQDGMILLFRFAEDFDANNNDSSNNASPTSTYSITLTPINRLMAHKSDIQTISWRRLLRPQAGPMPTSDKSDASSSSSSLGSNFAVLASGSKDATIRIWQVSSIDEHTHECVKTLDLPKPSYGGMTEAQKSRIWVTVSFSPQDPLLLVSSSYMGDIYQWNFDATYQKVTKKKFPTTHNRSVFDLCFNPSVAQVPQQQQSTTATKQKCFMEMMSISMDRSVAFWRIWHDPESKRQQQEIRSQEPGYQTRKEWAIQCLGGAAFSLHQNEVNLGQLCVGAADNTIRIWDTSAGNSFSSKMLWKGIQSKVTVVCWHPSVDNFIAFGTHDGRVGTCYGNPNNDQTVIFTTYHKGPVYELQWISFDNNGEYLLYSCGGDNIIYEFDPKNPHKRAQNVAQIIEKRLSTTAEGTTATGEGEGDKTSKHQKSGSKSTWSEFAFNNSATLCAIGHNNGYLEFYKVDPPAPIVDVANTESSSTHGDTTTSKATLPMRWSLLHKASYHSQLVNRLRWNKGSSSGPALQDQATMLDTSSTAGVPSYNYNNWLASASDDGTICIYDLTPLQSSTALNMATIAPASDPAQQYIFRTLKGHRGPVTGICWSPHNPALLVSSSFDGTAQVWDVVKGQGISNFRDHSIGAPSGLTPRVFSVQWSVLYENIIYSGGDDDAVREWDYTTQEGTLPPKQDKPTKKVRKAKQEPSQVEPVVTTANEVILTKPAVQTATTPEEPKPPAAETRMGTTPAAETVATAAPALHTTNFPPYQQQQQQPVIDSSKKEKRKQKKEKEVKSFLRLSNTANDSLEHKQEGCLQLIEYLQQQGTDQGKSKMKTKDLHADVLLHGAHTHKGMVDLLEREANEYQPDSLPYRLLHLWAGNLTEALLSHIGSPPGGSSGGTLFSADTQQTLMFLALSPAAGRDVWLNYCKLSAQRLEANGDIHASVALYLATQEIVEAVKVYQRAQLYRDAILLGKLRLGPHHPLVREIFLEWAQKSIEKNLYEVASKCYLSLGDIENAIKSINRRTDLGSLLLCARLAASPYSNRHDLAVHYSREFGLQCWERFRPVILKGRPMEQQHDDAAAAAAAAAAAPSASTTTTTAATEGSSITLNLDSALRQFSQFEELHGLFICAALERIYLEEKKRTIISSAGNNDEPQLNKSNLAKDHPEAFAVLRKCFLKNDTAAGGLQEDLLRDTITPSSSPSPSPSVSVSISSTRVFISLYDDSKAHSVDLSSHQSVATIYESLRSSALETKFKSHQVQAMVFKEVALGFLATLLLASSSSSSSNGSNIDGGDETKAPLTAISTAASHWLAVLAALYAQRLYDGLMEMCSFLLPLGERSVDAITSTTEEQQQVSKGDSNNEIRMSLLRLHAFCTLLGLVEQQQQQQPIPVNTALIDSLRDILVTSNREDTKEYFDMAAQAEKLNADINALLSQEEFSAPTATAAASSSAASPEKKQARLERDKARHAELRMQASVLREEVFALRSKMNEMTSKGKVFINPEECENMLSLLLQRSHAPAHEQETTTRTRTTTPPPPPPAAALQPN